jgi:hypothetical protein
MATVDNNSGGWQQRQQRMTTAANEDSGGWRRFARSGGRLRGGRRRAGGKQQWEDGGGGGQRRRTMTTATADDNNSNNRQWQQQTLTAADDNGMQNLAADYKAKEKSGQQTTTALGREREKINIEFTQKAFFQQYGLSGWIFCSRKNSQCALFGLSVLFGMQSSAKSTWEVVQKLLLDKQQSTFICKFGNPLGIAFPSCSALT